MRTSLSIRIAESPRDKSTLAVGIDALLDQARTQGFAGVSLRASAISVHSPADAVLNLRHALQRHGLQASMVTGDLPLAINNAQATAALYNIAPYLDLAQKLGAKLIRVMLHEESDIAAAQRAADAAAERELTLAQQCHWGSLAETAEAALALAKRVKRHNFGITYEPANLLASGGAFGADAIAQLAPHLVNVYFQNLCLDEHSALKFITTTRGPVGVRFLPLGDADGIDATPIVAALRRVNYAGWFTVHQPLLADQSIGEAIEAAGAFARECSAAIRA